MGTAKSLKIVPVSDIPLGENVSIDRKDLFKIYKICLQLRDLCEKENGIGISAVQAGIPMKLFLIKRNLHYAYYVNCEYSPIGNKKLLHMEGCLSLKTVKDKLRTFEVERAYDILLNGYQIEDTIDLELKEIKEYPISGFYAAVFAHEIDHQLGITIDQIGKEIDLTIG